jgi:hypothetical protein
MEEQVRLNNDQINAILDASYNLTNKMGAWFDDSPSDADAVVLQALSLVEKELRALFDACPDLTGRAHTPAEIQTIVHAGLELLSKFASAFPTVNLVPDVIRKEIKALYFALHDAGLVDTTGE